MLESLLLNKKLAAKPAVYLVLALDFETYPPQDLASTRTITTNGGGIATPTTSLNGTNAYYNSSTSSGAYIAATDNGDLQLTGDFTIEYWHLLGSTSGSQRALAKKGKSNQNGLISIIAARPNFLDDTNTSILNASTQANTTSWIHHCWTRKGSTLRYIRNGTKNGETTWSGTWGAGTEPLYVAGRADNTLQCTTGYIDRLRIWQGCQYWDDFTPSSAPYPN